VQTDLTSWEGSKEDKSHADGRLSFVFNIKLCI